MNNNLMKPANPIQRYEQYLNEDPENIVLLTTLGNLYHQENRLVDAIHCFKRCLELDKKNPIAKMCLAKTLISAKRYHLAEKILVALIEQNHVDSTILQDLGVSLYFQQRWQEALSYFERSGLDDINNLHFACHCLHHQKHYAKALSYAKKLAELHNSADTQSYLALLEADNGHFVIAKKRALMVLRSQPDNINANLTMALCLLEHDQYDSSLPYLETVLTQSAHHPRALFYLALHDLLKQRPRLALERLEPMKQQDQRANFVLFILMGWIQFSRLDNLEASEYFHKALLLSPSSADAYMGLAVLAKLEGQIDKSTDYIDRIKHMAPEHISLGVTQPIFEDTPLRWSEVVGGEHFIHYLKELITDNSRGIESLAPKLITLPTKNTARPPKFSKAPEDKESTQLHQS